MGMHTTSNPADIVNRYQIYFSKKLLVQTVDSLVLHQFAVTQDLPRNAGATSMRFFRRREGDASQVQTLAEGTPISTFTEITTEKVDVNLVQLGEAAKSSDIVLMTDIFDHLNMNIEVMGEDCALKADTVTRNAVLLDGTYGLLGSDSNQERFAGVANTGVSADDFATLLGKSANDTKINRARALVCATQLRANKAPRINGSYVAVLPPEIQHDLVQDDDWLEAAKYSRPDMLFKGEVGMLDGVRYIAGTNPLRESAYGVEDPAGPVFTTLFFGKGAYGVAKLAGTQSPHKPKVFINNQPDKADPLNQFAVVGWKAFYAAVCLDKRFVVALRSKSTFN